LLIFGDKNGNITLFDKGILNDDLADQNDTKTNDIGEKNHGKCYKVFRGEIRWLSIIYDSSHSKHLGSSQNRLYIVSIGDDSKSQSENDGTSTTTSTTTNSYTIKVFSITDLSRPLLQVFVPPSSSSLSASSVSSDGGEVALGFADGSVLLFLLATPFRDRDHLPSPAAAPTRAAVVLLPSHPCSVSSLHFCELPPLSLSPSPPSMGGAPLEPPRRTRLFATFDTSLRDWGSGSTSTSTLPLLPPPADGLSGSGILIFDTSFQAISAIASGVAPSLKILDDRGAAPQCATLMRNTCELVVARSEAVYNYSVDDIGGALAVSGEKVALCEAGRYTLIASIDDKSNTSTSSSADYRNINFLLMIKLVCCFMMGQREVNNI
jgi:hypothetical protein